MNQLAFFEETTLDIRTEKQVNNLVSYDVGEKIGGARKDLAESRKNFLMKPSSELLESLEKQDVQTAAELVVKSTFFSWFSLEDCKERGVEPSAAKALQLLISRIPKTSKDTPEERSQYMKALIFLSDLLQTVYSFSHFRQAVTRISNMLALENYSEQRLLQIIESDKESIRYEDDSCIYKAQLTRRLEEWTGYISILDFARECNISNLGGTFITFFKNQSSRKSLLSNAGQYSTWEELLPTVNKDKDVPEGKGKVQRQPVWVRALPKEPTRHGGKSINIETPEAFIQHFGFRSSEFGHYMNDQISGQHLSRAAEAYTDLANLMNIPTDAVSLSGGLAMAFGSRGRGKAMGHYEPARKVINLTKEKGSLGILAHEWFHAMDHYLYSLSYGFQNGKVGYVTNGEYGHESVTSEMQDALNHLLETIKNGKSIGYIDVSNVKGTYRLTSAFRSDYADAEGDLKDFMDTAISDFDERADRHLNAYLHYPGYDSLVERYAKKRKQFIKSKAEAVAQYHEEKTGERVERIPYTTNRTNYYETSIGLDKGKIGKYWSSSVELTARAFESYIYDLLQQRNWTSDYLVCGVRDSVFPYGEESKVIHAAMSNFIETILPILQRATRDQLKK